MIHVGGEIVTHNPAMKYPLRRLRTGWVVQPVHWSDDPEKTEEWADKFALRHYGGRHAPGWLREMEMELVRGGLAVWPMLDTEVHQRDDITSAELCGDGWTLYRSLDHGIRHPTCCAWVAVNKDGDRYFYRQYYSTDTTIGMNCKAILDATGGDECISLTVADPSIWQREAVGMRTLASVYADHNLPLVKADNSRAGYDWLTRGFQSALARWSIARSYRPHPKLPQTISRGDLEQLAASPAIWFHPSCADGARSLFEQCRNLRWREVQGDPMKRAAPEEYEDKDDEGPDVLRYACQTSAVYWRRARRPVARGQEVLLEALRRADRLTTTRESERLS